MYTIGLVEVVQHLPPPAGTTAVTALQIRAWAGFEQGCYYVHAFAKDDPLAATLRPGSWVQFKKPARGKRLTELAMLEAASEHAHVSAADNPREQVDAAHRLLQFKLPTASVEALRQEAVEAQRRLETLRVWFNLKQYPLELFASCFSAKTAKLLQVG